MNNVIIVAGIAALAACQSSPPEPLTIENTEQLEATVEAVDHSTRALTLRAPNGERQTIEVSSEVRNFAQIQPGDRVLVRYYEGLAAQVAEKGEGTPVGQVDASLFGGRSDTGQRPAAALGDVVTTTVVIESVDRSSNTVTFAGPQGTRTVSVKRPEAQKFIAGLKSGDEVDITYMEALAVSVEPSP